MKVRDQHFRPNEPAMAARILHSVARQALMQSNNSNNNHQLVSSIIKKHPLLAQGSSFKRFKSDSSSNDLVVEYLEGNSKGIVVFGLNRPKAKNSFSKNLVAMISEAMDAVRFDKNCRALVLRSTTPGIFCAGADLKERAKMKPSEVRMDECNDQLVASHPSSNFC